MKICDICGGGTRYVTSAVIDDKGNTKKLDLCGVCYDKLYHKEQHHRYLAYAEVVEERTGKSAKKPSLMERLKSIIGW